LIALALLLAAAIALPFFVALNHCIPQIEREISARLNARRERESADIADRAGDSSI